MKKLSMVIWIVFVGVLWAQANPRGKVGVTLQNAVVEIDYGRPDLKGRDWSGVEKGTVWRMGADQPTTLTTDRNLTIRGVAVPPGTYVLMAEKAGPSSWELIISRDSNASAGGRDLDLDVGSVPLELRSLDRTVERLTIEFKKTGENQTDLLIQWGDSALSVPVIAVSGLGQGR